MMRGAIAAILLLPGVGWGATPLGFDARLHEVVEEYLKIQEALANDRVDGVPAAARRIQKLVAGLDKLKPTASTAKHAGQIRAKLVPAAERLAKAADLARLREAFKEVSRPLALWVTVARPPALSVVYCSMAKASWLQRNLPIRNPYYGPKMLTCGEVVGGKSKGHSDGHMGK